MPTSYGAFSMSVTAKCHNYTGCLQAYRGEEIQLAPGAPMVCPECGKPVTLVPKGASKIWALVPWILLLAAMGAGVYYGLPYAKRRLAEASPGATPAPAVASATPIPAATPVPATPRAVTGATAEPPIQLVAPKKVEMALERQETRAVRDDVLQRIDLIPGLTPVEKDKLYNSVQRARSMGLALTIPFPSGRSALAGGDVPSLKAALETPEIMKFRDDPTAVFVVLGYADAKGDEKGNLRVSKERADSVVTALRTKCGVVNVTHSVAMGGSKLHDTQSLEKNRIVEIWVVLP